MSPQNVKDIRNIDCSLGGMATKFKLPSSWILLIMFLCIPSVNAMTASPHAFPVQQLNETVMLKINGDEFSHWITDTNDYAVVRDASGVYAYAELAEDGKLIPSENKVVGRGPPTDGASIHRRPSNTNQNVDGTEASAKGTMKRRGSDSVGGFTTPTGSLRGSNQQSPDHHRRLRTATIGTLNNLVVLIRFRDHQRRSVPTKNQINVLMNSEEAHPTLAPTGSLKMVYWENSYGQLTIESTVTDWVQVRNHESYYAAGTSGVGPQRLFQEALVEALDTLEAQNFDFLKFDKDRDGNIDSITFLTSGYGAEWGGDGFENRIWSHQWNINWSSARSGVRVTNYHVSPALWGTSGSSIGRIGVIAHEIGHFLGLEDHYDIDYSGNGLGYFCLMANSWGYDGSQLYPPQMSAWSKMKLGWTTPRIPSVGLNRVARSELPASRQAGHHLYKIGDGSFGYPRGEYLLIEYRKTEWLRGGIAIYHIDENAPYDDEGYPGQIDRYGRVWPQNGLHYKIALVPADGSYGLERGENQGNSLDLFTSGQYLVPKSVLPGANLYPNTDTYQGGRVFETGVELYALSDPTQDFMSFAFWDGETRGWNWLSNYFVKPVQGAGSIARAPSASLPSSWQTIISENFDNGSGLFALGDSAKLENKKCQSGGGCVKIEKSGDDSTISVQVDAENFTDLDISFSFLSNGLKDGEEIRLEYLSGDWNLLKSWMVGRDSIPVATWTSTSVVWKKETPDNFVRFQFRTTSEKKGFYIDDVVIRGR